MTILLTNSRQKQVYLLCILLLITKLCLLPFAQTVHPDAVSRVFGAIEWMNDPHWIKSATWCPFHFYLNGIALSIWNNPIYTPKGGAEAKPPPPLFGISVQLVQVFRCLGVQHDSVDSILCCNICRPVHFATGRLMLCPMQKQNLNTKCLAGWSQQVKLIMYQEGGPTPGRPSPYIYFC